MEPPTRSDLGFRSQESESTKERNSPTQAPELTSVTQSKESPDPTGCWSGGSGPKVVWKGVQDL